jgi:hypothetical protein
VDELRRSDTGQEPRDLFPGQSSNYNWLAAAPIIVFGAPLGAYLVGVIPRIRTLYFVSLLCLIQFVFVDGGSHAADSFAAVLGREGRAVRTVSGIQAALEPLQADGVDAVVVALETPVEEGMRIFNSWRRLSSKNSPQ